MVFKTQTIGKGVTHALNRHTMLLVNRRLEGKQCQHQVHGAFNLMDSLFSIGPQAGTDVVNGLDILLF